MDDFQDRCLDDGCAAVVRNGYLPEYDIQTGVEPGEDQGTESPK
ncbi:hypothetical protein [Microbulbifer sp. GL-2]